MDAKLAAAASGMLVLSVLVILFGDLLDFGVGFLVTNVRFWQVAGFAFAAQFTKTFALTHAAAY